MTKLRTIGCVAVGAAALLAGCGKSSSSGTEKLQLNSFVAKAADTVCSALAKCGCTDSSAVTSCKQAYVSSMTDALDMQLLAYPGQTVDPDAAQKCLDDAKAELADCSVTPGTTQVATALLVGVPGPGIGDLPGCDMTTIFKPLQTAGESCSHDAECVAGLACDEGMRVCGTPAALNGDCNFVSCVDTAYCPSGGTCLARLAAGDACSPADYWGKPECGTGLECDFSLGQGHDICVAPVAIGASCSDGQPCVAGAYCDGGTTQCTAVVADGGDCTTYYQCAHQFCNSQGKCADPGICSMSGIHVM
jgi:hypothetical protein